jgi:hypothetical protein
MLCVLGKETLLINIQHISNTQTLMRYCSCRPGMKSRLLLLKLTFYRTCMADSIPYQSLKLKSRYGARNRFQEPILELSNQATYRMAGRYDNPMPTWFLKPPQRDLSYRHGFLFNSRNRFFSHITRPKIPAMSGLASM